MSLLARVRAVVQWMVGVGAATAVVLLFSLEGAPDAAEAPVPGASDELIATGRDIYARSCASCHGDAGQGGQGPRLAGTVVATYPDATDEIELVTNGRNAMPPFASLLTEEEIAAVVTFTRFGFP